MTLDKRQWQTQILLHSLRLNCLSWHTFWWVLCSSFFHTLASYNIMNNKSVQVKWWITFVDPDITVKSYIPSWNKAPGVNSPHVGLYLAIHTLIQSHSRAHRLYNNEFRDTQKGKVSWSMWHYLGQFEGSAISHGMKRLILKAWNLYLFYTLLHSLHLFVGHQNLLIFLVYISGSPSLLGKFLSLLRCLLKFCCSTVCM